MNSEPKRKQNFVDAGVQGGLIRRIFVHWLTFFAVTALAVIALKTLLGEPSLTFAERFQEEMRDFIVLGIVFLAVFPAFMLDTIRFSNRFVGPISRLRRHLVQLSEQGHTEDISFRGNDFWQAVADEYNQVNALVQSQQQQIATLERERSAVQDAASV